ncbi:MAG TPA: type II toxin-antitoxin system RelE/ParE family toxin [Burkholderiaceae bacterium]|jgi:toxin ParE1/3/4|nr:type II toxin-antitoxin system RelE/ParE family toxin [Burkholderiaceae bacterium]
MSLRYRITPKAKEDLKNIGRYTQQKWGKEQRNRYLKNLYDRFSWLAENPELGRLRPEVKEHYYSYAQGEHIIFYIVSDHMIDIIGIPHQKMDVPNYFLTQT